VGLRKDLVEVIRGIKVVKVKVGLRKDLEEVIRGIKVVNFIEEDQTIHRLLVDFVQIFQDLLEVMIQTILYLVVPID
jgi:hypothetical protein